VAEALRQRGVRARWLFFGRCPELSWARAEAARRGFADDFTIDDTLVPHSEVAARVLQARIGFIPLPDLPKFQHNLPTKLFEFMALSMPTVLSDLPPSRPFVGDGACAVMVPADDPGAYADAITRLLDDPELRRSMGAEGRRRVEGELNWQRESRHLLDLYAELL
jgi:glycosyltransferase involved in cell wall biosynthesis